MTLAEIFELYYPAVRGGDVAEVRRLLDLYPDPLAMPRELTRYLHIAAEHNRVTVLELLVGRGADLNAGDPNGLHVGALHEAAASGSVESVRWLLARGSQLTTANPDDPCPGLSQAAQGGHLECVRLLVEAGVPLNAVGKHALNCAKYSGHTAVADYLRSVGVPDDEPEPEEKPDVNDQPAGGPIPELRRHLEQRLLGTVEPDAFQNILPTDPPIAVLVLDQFGVRKALVTEGLSAVVLPGDDRFAHAELILRVPADWPLDLTDDARAWPVTWLRRMARLPLEHGTNFKLFTLYDHEEPLGPGVRFTGFLVIVTPGDHGGYTRADGRRVQLYDLLPLYPDELAFADEHGVKSLLAKLDGRDDVVEVTPGRPSLVS